MMHRLGFYPFGGPAVLTPPGTDMWAWYMGSEAYTETSGTPTTKQTTDAGAIGSLKDMSGNGRHMYQATTAAKPTLVAASAMNSLPAIRTASGDFMATAASTFIPTTSPCNFSLYAVLRPTGWQSNAALFATDFDPGIVMPGWTTSNTDEYCARYGNDSGSQRNILKWAQGANHLITMSQSLSSIIYHSIDNLQGVNGFPTAPSSTSGGSATKMQLCRFAGNGYFIGDIVELIVYNGNSAYHKDGSGGNGLLVKQYLDWKYNLGLGIQNDGFPYISGSVYNAYGSGTNISVTLPTDIVAGDLLVVFNAPDNNFTTTFPAGWTKFTDISGGSNALTTGWRICDGTEGASITITLSSATQGRYIVAKIKGAATTGTPIENGVGVATTSSSGNPPSLTASWGALNNLWIAASALDTSATMTTWPTGYTQNRLDGQGFGSASVAICSKKAAVATDDPAAFTFSASASIKSNTYVIRPP